MLTEITNVYLEKMAATKKNMDQREQTEREYIRRVQQFNDPIAMQQLIMMYRPVLENAIRDSGIVSSSINHDMAMQIAVSIFTDKVKNQFDLNKGIKPVTYFSGFAITGALKNYKNDIAGGAVKIPQKIALAMPAVNIAMNNLKRELGREPKDKEILTYIKDNLNTGSKITPAVLKNVKKYMVKELSGSLSINPDAGGTPMTFTDTVAVTKNTPEDILKRDRDELMIQQEIRNFAKTPAEQRFLEQYLRVGMYRNQNINLYQASVNNGITNGKARVERFLEYLKKKGLL